MTYTCKRPTRVICINIKIQKPKLQHVQQMQKLQPMNYGIYAYNKIEFEFTICWFSQILGF